ncbi:MAG: AAA family ATPase [Proteobacteria bacterium]|nr:AAA family ATPase [Pseudomonadota bacterium]
MDLNDEMNFPGYSVLEQLGKTHHSAVYRACKTGGDETVIIKVIRIMDPSPSAIARLKHEYELIRSITLDGIVKSIDFIQCNGLPVLILEDFGGISLKEILIDGFTVERFLGLAIRLAEILGELHQINISHRDIKPHNILLNRDSDILKITDFGISAEMFHDPKEITNPAVMEGTLAYISPEQTGRINCDVDYRTDLYSLGVTFYEMLTGMVPFRSMEPMEIIHGHIAKIPMPPSSLKPDIPVSVSDIVMKLLSKSPSDRYQNCMGLGVDLHECLRQLHLNGRIEPFALGSQDIPLHLNLPRHLVGRDKSLDLLHKAFDRIRLGSVELVMVTGDPGIGKSALVNELYKPAVAKKGYYIAGKFDQFQQGVPYSAFIQAFQSLTLQLFAENNTQLRAWKTLIQTALGPNGKIITDVIPEIELIIGKQPDIPDLGPDEMQNRFNLVFKNFVHIFADQAHPLVMFLDDLQWADRASLNLISAIVRDRRLSCFLFVGAYRDKEISLQHPGVIDAVGIPLQTIHLEALKPDDIRQWVISSMRCEPETALALAQAIFTKTQGNPFFINQFLKTLYDKKYLCFDSSRGWSWSIEKIQQLDATENVVTFLTDKLNELSPESLEIITRCACIGNRFNLDTLRVISQRSIDEIVDIMGSLMQDGLVSRTGEYYGFYHDRIQEAAHSLLSTAERERTHYQIGMFDLGNTGPEKRFNRIFSICDQLNQATSHISDQNQRTQLAELNLMAGIKAKDSTAYAAAVNYLDSGSAMLAHDSWQTDYDLTYALFTEHMECRYLNRDFVEAERLFGIIIQHAATNVDKANAYNTMITLYTATRSAHEAIELGIEALRIFGISININVGVLPVITGVIRAKHRLEKIGLENIFDFPTMRDKELCAIHNLFLNISVPAFYVNSNLFALLVLKGFSSYIKHGLSPHASVTFIVVANLVQNVLGDYKLANRIGEMALKLDERFDNPRVSGMVQHAFAFFILHWKKHARFGLDMYAKTYELSMNTGNFIYAGHSICTTAQCRIMLGHPIDDVLNELNKHQDFMMLLKDPHVVSQYQLSRHVAMTLKGLIPVDHDLSGDAFNLSKTIDQFRQSGNSFGLSFMLYSKMLMRVWQKKFNEAQELGAELDQRIRALMGTQLVVNHYFNYSLILIVLLRQGERNRKKKFHALIRRNQRKLLKWSHLCPENFQHKYDLVTAELEGLNGNFHKAMEFYHAAIKGARKNGYLSDEALACEKLADFYLECDFSEEARVYIIRSHKAYVAWGATAMITKLQETYKAHFRLGGSLVHGDSHSATTSSDSLINTLDFSTIMKASQVISGEIMLDSLLKTTMHMSLSNAGAQRGYLIFESKGQLIVQASENIDTGEKKVLQSTPIEACEGLCPAIVNYVYHSGESLILANASEEGAFVNDPHVLRYRSKSVLCIPIKNKGRLACLLYMENNLTPEAFTPERLEILRVITTQTAISLQNARLYEDITNEISVRKEAEEAMRTSEEKYRTILEEMQDAYVETDFNGNIVFINPSVSTITGYTSSELIGSTIQKFISSSDHKKLEDYSCNIYKTGHPGKPLACNLISKNGTQIPLEIVTSLIRTKSGEIRGFRNVARNVSERKRLEHDLIESSKNVHAARTATILGLAKLAEYRDEDTGTHLERIREYARIIAQELAQKPEYKEYITPDYIGDIYNSAILHDIGKVGVPDAILLKPGKLTTEEFEIIKTHSTLGGDALRAVETKIEGQTFLTLSKEIAYYHHEKWNGSGYPKGLIGTDIPLSARIVALADVYDALTSKRVYKEAFSHQKAMDIIVKDRGTHFAPDVVDAFIVHADEFRRIREELPSD